MKIKLKKEPAETETTKNTEVYCLKTFMGTTRMLIRLALALTANYRPTKFNLFLFFPFRIHFD